MDQKIVKNNVTMYGLTPYSFRCPLGGDGLTDYEFGINLSADIA
jgi:hypothetical protein